MINLTKHIFKKHKIELVSVLVSMIIVLVFVLYPLKAATGPVASNVLISGTPVIGQTLTGSYDYTNVPWVLVGTAGFSTGGVSDTSFVFNSSGVPYISYSDDANSFKASVMKWNGTTWEFVGTDGFSSGVTAFNSLALNSSGVPYVAFKDDGVGVTVMKFNGTTWELVGTANFSDGVAENTSIAIASDGTPYVAYRDYANASKLTVKKFTGITGPNPTGWTLVGTAGFSAESAVDISFALDSTDIPYVAYANGVDNKATVMKFNGVDWELVGTSNFSAGITNAIHLAINSTGVSYVSYMDYGNGNKTTVMKFNGTAWELVGTAGFSSDVGDFMSFALDSTGTPYIAYRTLISDHDSTYKSNVMKWNGTTWELVGILHFSAGPISSIALAINPTTGIPYIAFGDSTISSKATVMKYDPVPQGTSTFKWFRDGVVIPEKTDITYVVQTADLRKNISFEVTPISQTPASGTPVLSSNFAIPVPFTDSLSVSGTLNVGETIAGSYSYNDATGGFDSEGATTFRWLRDGAPIAGETTVNYTLANIDAGKTISFEVTPVGTSGAVGDPTTINVVTNSLPTALSVNITGTPNVGEILTGHYTYSDIDKDWSLVGLAGFSGGSANYESIAIDPTTGTPYVAYQDSTNSGKATVMKFDGTNWVVVGTAGFSDGQTSHISLALTSTGTPYVAYRDEVNSQKATVMKFDGTNWVVVGTSGFSPGIIFSASIALTSTGTPYVAFKDNSGGATVMKFNDTTWELVGTAEFSAGEAAYISLKINSTGTPYVVYADFTNYNKATVMKFDGTNWVVVGTAGFSAGQADYTSIAIDSTGTPYVAYRDDANSTMVTVMKFDGTNWVVVGTAGFSAGQADYTSIAIDSTGTPYVAYQDFGNSQKATVMKFDGTNWVVVGTHGFSSGSASYDSLALDPITGTPYVAYENCAGKSCAPAVKKLDFTDFEGSSTVQWYRDGVAISGEINPTYTLVSADAGTTIKFGVVTVALTGSTPGTEVQSSGLSIASLNGGGGILTPTPLEDGSCGLSDKKSFIIVPTSELCTYSSNTPILTGNGPWTWTCTGANGGSNASCKAESFQILGTPTSCSSIPTPSGCAVIPVGTTPTNPTTPTDTTTTTTPTGNTVVPTTTNTTQNTTTGLTTPTDNNPTGAGYTVTTPSQPVTVSNSNVVLNALAYILTPEVVNQIVKIANTSTAKIVTPVITTAGAVTGLVVTLASVVAVPFTAPGLATIPLRLWTLSLSMLGIKKKQEKWGSVYDSITMQPLDPAYVVLLNEKGEEVATSITDLDGRYGFPVNPGTYTLVANKTDYAFPSQKLAGRTEDVLHTDLYFGDTITIKELGEVITKNIPMDPLKFNWNEFAKGQQNLMHFYKKRTKILVQISNVLFDVGFVTAVMALIFAPIYWNIGIFGFYVLLVVLRHTKVFKLKKTGSITDDKGNLLSFAILRVYSATMPDIEIVHRVADQFGNFYCLIPNGNYIVKIEKKTGESTYEKVFTSEPIEVTKGIIDAEFVV